MSLMHHLPILPVLLPLVAGAAMLLISDSRHALRAAIALSATVAQLAVAIALLGMAGGFIAAPWAGESTVYALGNWSAPFGIVLVVDRLSAIMVTLCATLGLTALIYSLARWERAGVYYLSLFQFLLMGLNGAFLTGDLFNLFVFFEILLAASYGLALHGSGPERVKAGLHYVVVNLVASFVFLIAIALIYGVTGTLNMADIAMRISQLNAEDRALFDTGAILLGVVFLVKAAAWPLNFWLPSTYAAAAAPVGGIFAIMTKVGVYALLRFESLFSISGVPILFGGGDVLFYCGLATTAVGAIGILATQQLTRLPGFCIIVSSGTLLTVIGMDSVNLAGPALFYLVTSVLASGTFYMVIELAERNRAIAADFLAISFEAFGLQDPAAASEQPDEVVGVAIPAAMAFLGLTFILCALLLTGLPPFSGFVAKFSLIAAALTFDSSSNAAEVWLLIAALILSGLAGIIAFVRIGIRVFWSTERTTPRLQVLEAGPVAALLVLCVALTVGAGPAMSYFNATALSLHPPYTYIDTVLPGERPVPLFLDAETPP